MSKMRHYFILTFVVLGFQAKSQDHLEPTADIFSEYQFMYEYGSEIRDVLFERLSHKPMTRLVVLPAFSKEEIWQIEYDQELDKYYSVSRTGTHSIWYNQYKEKPEKIELETTKNEIDKETAELIKQLFLIAIRTVSYPDDEKIGLDGVNYYFSSFDLGIKSGTIWSPGQDSKMGRLVHICNELRHQTLKTGKLDEELSLSIKQLISEL